MCSIQFTLILYIDMMGRLGLYLMCTFSGKYSLAWQMCETQWKCIPLFIYLFLCVNYHQKATRKSKQKKGPATEP